MERRARAVDFSSPSRSVGTYECTCSCCCSPFDLRPAPAAPEPRAAEPHRGLEANSAPAASDVTTVLAADPPAADSSKLHTGLTSLAQLLQLMDTDKNGKVSKDEVMKFMEAEFEYANKDKNGELDPAELKNLVYKMSQPYRGVPRVGK